MGQQYDPKHIPAKVVTWDPPSHEFWGGLDSTPQTDDY